jgi:hypothetical protein
VGASLQWASVSGCQSGFQGSRAVENQGQSRIRGSYDCRSKGGRDFKFELAHAARTQESAHRSRLDRRSLPRRLALPNGGGPLNKDRLHDAVKVQLPNLLNDAHAHFERKKLWLRDLQLVWFDD